MLEYKKKKKNLLKDMFQTGQKKLLLLSGLRKHFHEYMLLMI